MRSRFAQDDKINGKRSWHSDDRSAHYCFAIRGAGRALEIRRETRRFSREPGRRPVGYVRASEASKSFDDPGEFVELPLANQIRPRVKAWREARSACFWANGCRRSTRTAGLANGPRTCHGIRKTCWRFWKGTTLRRSPFSALRYPGLFRSLAFGCSTAWGARKGLLVASYRKPKGLLHPVGQ